MVTLNDAFPSKYLKAADLANGPVIATIKSAELETIRGFDGKEAAKVVVYFAKKLKPLPLNRTNFETIVDISGSDDSENFAGTRIELFTQKVSGPNGPTDGVRVRAPSAGERPLRTKQQEPTEAVPVLADEDDEIIPFS